jgi:hypothetical protein
MSVDALPILAYKVAEAQFDLASAQSFISLRDQAVRVRTLLTAMQEAKLFDPRGTKRVLVVGGGYAGVSAALWLAHRQIDTTLIEIGDRPFGVQHGCSTRHLSLTQYDWPGLHHAAHDYPDGLTPTFVAYSWLGRSFVLPPPLQLRGAPPVARGPRGTARTRPPDHLATRGPRPASAHAADWETQFLMRLPSSASLAWMPRTRFRPGSVASVGGGVSLDLENLATGAVRSEWFDYVLYAAGFGSDGDRIPIRGGGTKATREFWSDDDLATPGTAPPPRVLISGGGDGAMQDFIRALVDPGLATASAVLARIVDLMRARHPGQRDAIDAAWARVEATATYAETQAGAAATWMGEREPAVWAELQRHHLAAAAELTRGWGPALVDALAQVVDRPLPLRELTLIYPDAVPGKVYALNRFLVMLLTEYVGYVTRPGSDFFGTRPPPCYPRHPIPATDVLPLHRLDIARSSFDPSTSEYVAAVDVPGGGTLHQVVDELLVRHGTRKPPPLGVRVGLHEVGLELGRIKLPFAAIR